MTLDGERDDPAAKAPRSRHRCGRWLGGAVASLLLVGAGAPAPVTVTREGERLHVTSEATPLAEILDAVGAELGVPVEYEGEPPRFPVTLTLQRRTPADVFLSLLDGTGVDYALQLDASGQGVARLLIQTPTQARPARPQRPTPPPVRRAPPQISTDPRVPDLAQLFNRGSDEPDEDAEPGDEDAGAPTGAPVTAPTPRPGRPAPAPLLFPGSLPAPTPTPPPHQP